MCMNFLLSIYVCTSKPLLHTWTSKFVSYLQLQTKKGFAELALGRSRDKDLSV